MEIVSPYRSFHRFDVNCQINYFYLQKRHFRQYF